VRGVPGGVNRLMEYNLAQNGPRNPDQLVAPVSADRRGSGLHHVGGLERLAVGQPPTLLRPQ